VRERLTAIWYSARRPAWLAPLEWLYRGITALRRLAYRIGFFSSVRVGRPVVVVGNLTVGGTGKTPLVIYLVEALQRLGYKVAVISRGYAGEARGVVAVTARSDPKVVGDEPVLIAARTRCNVFVSRQRVAAARAAVAEGADVIVSDDGLQHYALARDFEIAMIDGARGCGNGALLPRGPLREPLRCLQRVNAIVVNGGGTAALPLPASDVPVVSMKLIAADAHAVSGRGLARAVASFRGAPVHAVAGIGHPERFFQMLRDAGLDIREHPLPDHHPITANDLQFGDGSPVIMTEKDAVKCRAFADDRLWFVPVSASLPGDAMLARIVERIKQVPRG
jgi:tetraacyldisaccharide 4'-kinase